MKRILVTLVVALLALGAPFAAHAIDIKQAKQQGLVGETDTGYIAAVSAPNAEVQQLINQVNAARKKKFQEIAEKNGQSLAVVEQLAAKTFLENTPKGEQIKIRGSWQKK